MSTPTNILDIRPAIRRKRAAACQHSIVTVDDSAASLTCDDCEAGRGAEKWAIAAISKAEKS